MPIRRSPNPKDATISIFNVALKFNIKFLHALAIKTVNEKERETHTNRETMMPMCHSTYIIEIGS